MLPLLEESSLGLQSAALGRRQLLLHPDTQAGLGASPSGLEALEPNPGRTATCADLR